MQGCYLLVSQLQILSTDITNMELFCASAPTCRISGFLSFCEGKVY